MIAWTDIGRTYSGKSGCMCGCMGNYRETSRAKKMALTKLFKDPTTKLQLWDKDSNGEIGCLYADDGNRNNVVYILAGTDIDQHWLNRIAA